MGMYGEGRPGRQRNGQVVIHVVSITAVVQIGAGVRLGHRRRLSRSTSPSCSVKPLHPTTSTLLTRPSHTCSTQQHYEQIATPLEWKFTKDHLNALLERVAAHHADHTLAAYPDREYVTEISCQTAKVTMPGSMPVNSTAAPATMAGTRNVVHQASVRRSFSRAAAS